MDEESKGLDNKRVERVLDSIVAETDILAEEIANHKLSPEDNVDVLDVFCRLFAHITTVSSMAAMPRGYEDSLRGKVEFAVSIFRAALIDTVREALKLNDLSDPWAEESHNERLAAQILEEIKREKQKLN